MRINHVRINRVRPVMTNIMSLGHLRQTQLFLPFFRAYQLNSLVLDTDTVENISVQDDKDDFYIVSTSCNR